MDWIAFDFGNYQFYRFNIADSCLVIGTIMLIVYLVLDETKDNKKIKAESGDNKSDGKVLSLEEKQRLEEKNQSKSSETDSQE